LKPEWWGSPLAQGEKYQGREKTCDKKDDDDDNNNNNNNNNNINTIRKVLQAETGSLSGGVHHWLKRKSTRGERKPVTRNDDDDNNNNNNNNNNINTIRKVLQAET
jgi:hypothetical protein